MPIPISYSYRNLLALAVGVLAGIIPAWQASRVQIAAALRKVG